MIKIGDRVLCVVEGYTELVLMVQQIYSCRDSDMCPFRRIDCPNSRYGVRHPSFNNMRWFCSTEIYCVLNGEDYGEY